MDAEIWAGGEKVADWPHSELPDVGDTIVVDVEGNDEDAEVTKVGTAWNKFGAKTTRIEVKWTGAMPFIA